MRKFYKALLLLMTLSSGYFNTTAQFIVNNGLEISNSALVVTNGDWTNASGTIINNTGTIRTSDHFINDGTITGSGGFDLVYGDARNLAPGAGSLGYLIKNGIGNATITGNVNIIDSLVMNSGIIQMFNATDTIMVQSNGIVKADVNSFVEGRFTHLGNGTKLFPIGRGTTSLPLRIYNVQASKVTAVVTPAIPGATAGLGIDSLSTLAFAWNVNEHNPTDTAAFVEVAFPSSSIPVTNAVVAKLASDNSYVNIGNRSTNTQGAYTSVRSYSRALKGIFTIAYGVPVDPITDSLALVALFNSTNGNTWTNNTNWLSGSVDTWAGVTKTSQAITGINLSGNNLEGEVSPQFTDIQALTTIDLSNNKLTAIPDFTQNTSLTSLNVDGNKLTFSSLEPNATVPGLTYANQDFFGAVLEDTVEVNTPYTLNLDAGGTNTSYSWKFNGQLISGETQSQLSVASVNKTTMGVYTAEAVNPLLPGLTLISNDQKILAYANISGIIYAENNVPATGGIVRLLRVTDAAFDTTATADLNNDGTYNLNKIVLGNYQAVALVDTLTYTSALPTYYTNTLFWEEADTIRLENHLTDLNITSILEPGASTGPGVIGGTLEEDDGTGRVKKPKKVSGAGVSARRVEDGGRGKEEILTLVAYNYTNDNGAFSLTGLPTGNYLLNIQYPGYPMDQSSDVRLTIGDALKSEVIVNATVADGKIKVTKLTITNIYEQKDYKVQAFPNPAIEYIKLKFGVRSNNRTVKLTDLSGRIIYHEGAPEMEKRIDLNSNNPGIYLLQVEENGVLMKTLKVSIE